MAKLAIFLQNILLESCGKFNFKQCSLQKFLKILKIQREYMEMYFHGNQHPWAIKHPFISLYSKYQSLKYICLPIMTSPVFPSLDKIYCISLFQNNSILILIDKIKNEQTLTHGLSGCWNTGSGYVKAAGCFQSLGRPLYKRLCP